MKGFIRVQRRKRNRRRSHRREHGRSLAFIPCFENTEDLDCNGENWRRAIAFYRKYQVLHLRPPVDSDKQEARFDMSIQHFQKMFETFPSELTATFTCENKGSGGTEEPILIHSVFSFNRPLGSWYASSILQPVAGSCAGYQDDCVQNFLNTFLSIDEPRFLSCVGNITQSTPVWFFIGQHLSDISSVPLRGRPEHTDSITSTGTWHHQVCGAKTWIIRPFLDHRDWCGRAPRLRRAVASVKVYHLKFYYGKVMSSFHYYIYYQAIRKKWSPCMRHAGDGLLRFKVECRQGDLLFINTRLWWHSTQIPATHSFPDGLSISYARDFKSPLLEVPGKFPSNSAIEADEATRMTNVDGIYASRNVRKGDIVLTEDELPDCALPGISSIIRIFTCSCTFA